MPDSGMRKILSARRTLFVRLILAGAVLSAVSSGCGDPRESVEKRIGRKGYWRIERVRQSRAWALLHSVGFISRLLGDPARRGDRFWYVSPSGKRVFVRLMNGISPEAGDANPDALITSAAERMAGWGFTGFGCGTDVAAWMPHSAGLCCVASLSLGARDAGVDRGVFEDSYADSVLTACDSLASILNGNPGVIGVLWDTVPAPSPRRLLREYAAMEPGVSKSRLVDMMREICRNDPAELKARIPAARSFDELPFFLEWGEYKFVDQEAAAFAGQVYAAWGEKVRSGMQARLPDYVNLGPLLDAGTPVEVVQSLAAHVDVLTFTVDEVSGRLPRGYFESVHEATGKPMMVLDLGRGPAVRTPEGHAAAYRRLARGCAGLPFVVACGCACYRDRESDGRGFLDATGAARPLPAQAAGEVNPGLDADHGRGMPAEAMPEYYAEDRFAAGPPVQEIARFRGHPAVDGSFAEWDMAKARLKDFRPLVDLDAEGFAIACAAWNDEGLGIALEVEDDAIELVHREAYWHEADSVEIMVDASGSRPEEYGPPCLHVAVVPRGGGKSGLEAYARAVPHPGSSVSAAGILAASSFSPSRPGKGPLLWNPRMELAPGVWKMEVFIPWKCVPPAPRAEGRVGFNLIVSRITGAREDGMFWARPRGEAGIDHPSTWGELILKDVIP